MAKIKNKTPNIVGKIVDILTPLTSEERQRVISASLMLLGETSVKSASGGKGDGGEEVNGLPDRARAWAKQNNLSLEDLQQSFHISDGKADVIAADIPGKNKKERTYNAYILAGIATLLSSGYPYFDDKTARALCETSGCYDSANHATYLKGKGNEFTGTKDKGWTLTAPGLKRGASLVKELSK
jgi:hypothetical protein